MWIGKRDEVGANDTWRRNGSNTVTAGNIIACLLRLNMSNVSVCGLGGVTTRDRKAPNEKCVEPRHFDAPKTCDGDK